MILNTSSKRPMLALVAIALMASAAPAQAQKTSAADAATRLNKIEAELKAVQRVVFPGGDGKYFPPEIEKGTTTTTAAGTPATTPVTDLLTRMDSVEAQMSRLTAQGEENGNRIAQLEAKLAAMAAPPPPPAPAAITDGTAPTPAKPADAVPTPKPAITTANLAPAPATAKPKPAAAAAPAAEKPATPSAKRVAAVKAIEKPATDDAGDDEYSYGYRLWEAKFFPEAEQQLQLFISKYPKHARISYGRNLLGRTLLDDGKPKEAAQWFLKNYQADAKGARAPDSLIYLAESMRQLKDVKRACIALGEFADGYRAESEGRLKTIYNEVKSGVKCN